MAWANFGAIFSQTRLVTLTVAVCIVSEATFQANERMRQKKARKRRAKIPCVVYIFYVLI
jgi:hypothetical protein